MPIEHFPKSWYPFLYRLREFLKTDATVMLVLGLGILTRGVSYLPWLRPPVKGTHPAESIFTMPTWSFVWIIVGVICIAGAFIGASRIQTLGFSIAIALNMAWGVSFLFSSVFSDSPRGWVSSIGYFSVVALALWGVWRGRAGEIQIKGV